MRAAIARTVSEAWRTIPHFAVTVAVEMGEAERVRQELRETGSAVSVNDMIVKAAVLALARFPQVNASFGGDRIVTHADINIGIAVAVEGGLLVPVIRGCQGLTLAGIAAASRSLVDRARTGKIGEAEIGGGTFSVSNLGMFGVDQFIAVLNPPQASILAVGATRDQVVPRDGELHVLPIMTMTLTCDHRAVDGATGAEFLQTLKALLEEPGLAL
jgi:pyruvate dehydrogenase E2 component (dihydrolipoamide acetyltransferase)